MQSPNSPDENSPSPPDEPAASQKFPQKYEPFGLAALALMLVYFLINSWRKWPDPLVDYGQQLYTVWRVSHGALLYHDFVWSYGPISVCFDAALFRIFGPGIMVLVTANLIVYTAILVLAYIAFRKAFGSLGAFAALAVFISVFSFLHLLAVGNYNYATPYSAESTHGMLLILVAALVIARWIKEPSPKLAFAVGLCGGIAAVLKPEFMLATGILGLAALALRYAQRQRVTLPEFSLLAIGVLLPTLAFTIWFARSENWSTALFDASQAWLVIFVGHIQTESGQQLNFSGLDHPWLNVRVEIEFAALALAFMLVIWAAGKLMNRPFSTATRLIIAIVAPLLIFAMRSHADYFRVGRCLPGLMIVCFIIVLARLRRELRVTGRAGDSTIMALLLVLLGGAMLARMPLFARVFHLGFFQAALAAMVVAAMMLSYVPNWVGKSPGRCLTIFCAVLTIVLFCVPFAMTSRRIRADQTEPIGHGRDRFYSTTREIDGTGALVNWAADALSKTPPDATVLVLPEGTMINYLSRHRTVEPGWLRGDHEIELLRQMRLRPPDFVVLISRNLSDLGVNHFGAPGNFGYDLVKWVSENYIVAAKLGGDPLVQGPPGAVIFRKK